MKKINEYDKFLEERWGWQFPKYSKEKIQELIAKAKPLIPKEKMDSFIEDNKEQIEEVANLITDEEGKIDYGKVKEFFNANIKKKK